MPLNSNGDFAGNFGDLFSAYTVFAGLAVVLLFAFHGATFLTLRTTGDLCERAAQGRAAPVAVRRARRLALLAWTVAVATDHNHKDVFPPVLPAALGIAALRARRRLRAAARAERLGVRDDRARHRGCWWRPSSPASTRA